MTVCGADVIELRLLAEQFERAASRLDSGRMTVGNAIRISAWVGPFAVNFRLQWDSEHSHRVATVVSTLHETASKLRANADEQERASAATGGVLAGRAGAAVRPPSGVTPPAGAGVWWQSLSPDEQRRLIQSDPEAIGSLDGLPADVRDEANRILLDRELQLLRSTPRPDGGPTAAVYDDRLNALTQAKKVLDTERDAHLLLLDDSTHPTRVAIALGDVDTADHVAVFTQGVDSGAGKPGGLTGPVDQMQSLRAEAQQQLIHDGRRGESVATVVWEGYEAPPNVMAGAVPTYGEQGAPALAAFADGIRANNPDGQITALGHSYGSYVTGLAAQRTDAFNDVVVFGSPGIGTSDVHDLHVPAGHVFEAQAPNDPIPWFGFAVPGRDPSAMSGVTPLSAGAHGTLESSSGHSEYLKDDSTSQYNMALVVDGLGDRVIH